MARVAVLHNTLDLRGGADAVCLHVCEALQDDHDVTLFTISKTALSDLNGTFDTAVDVPVEQPPFADPLARGFDAATPYVGPQLPLRSVLLYATFRRHAAAFDVAVSTANEFDLPLPSVQYVHFPQFFHRYAPAADPGHLNPLWSRLAGPQDRSLPADATVVANSAWTADVAEPIYGRRPGVVHPPVDPIPDPLPWDHREQGIVLVGRIAPDKRALAGIEVVDRVRERGHDCHLHVVGTAAPAYREYVQRVERAAANRDYVSLERDVSRDRLEHVLATHRYGLNMKREEHFGMALAECVAAGILPFAPDGGGQRDVVGDPDRLFDSPEDAAATIARAIERDDRPTDPRDRFGSDRFHAEIRRLVADRL
jgi:glycosyltransferase involved in cell wall biosynthesis